MGMTQILKKAQTNNLVEKTKGAPFCRFTRKEIQDSIHGRFDKIAARYPEQLAIYSDHYQWTYRELSQLVDRVASAVLSMHEAVAKNVVLLFDQDAPMVAGMLGVLKAGKAYVPLDPTNPQRRLEYMVKDAQASIIVACDSTNSLALELAGDQISLINVEALPQVADQKFPEVSPYDLAYILFTSGSTGKPKGVVQNHRNVLHFIRNYTNSLQLNSDDKLTLLSTYTFDAAVMDIFSAVLNGACLFPKSVTKDGFASITPWIIESKITIYHSTPTVYRYSLKSGDHFPSVRFVVLGGETVLRSDVEFYRQNFSSACMFMNLLGSTESSFTLQNIIDKTSKLEGKTVPVGTAVDDTQVYLIDKSGVISPSEGEIVFKSEHVLLEYWNQPELTQSVLKVDPQNSNERAYHTGDLGRWKHGGMLEFLGRKDFQIKIHGIRIELGEVEAVLRAIKGIDQAVVIPQPSITGDTELVAYIISDKGLTLDEKKVRAQLADELPLSMCPNTFVKMDAYPLTRTGKIDRKSFPKPRHAKSGHPKNIVAPETRSQEDLLAIWTSLLEIEGIGIDDDFFDLGGDSLLALRLCDIIRQQLDYSIPLLKVFECRSIRKIAGVIDDGDKNDDENGELIPLCEYETPRGSNLFCICGINIYQALADAIGSPHSVYGVYLPVEQSALLEGAGLPSVEKMAAMYGEVIRRKQPSGPYNLAGLSFGGILAYELARQLHANGEKVEILAMFDSTLPNMMPMVKKAGAHARLALNLGSSYIIPKIKKQLGIESRTEQPEWYGEDIAIEDRAVAELRGSLYSESAKAYRKLMLHYDGDVVYFRALDRSEYQKLVDGNDCGWSQLVNGKLDVVETPGGHITMLQQPNVEIIAQRLRKELDRTKIFHLNQ